MLFAPAAPAQQYAPQVRIVERIDESQLTTLKGNTLPVANAKNDRGLVSPNLPMTDLILVLKRSPEQQAAFDKYVASQYDATSPNFHHWMTAEESGENFGVSQTDIATISNWLTGHGFRIDAVAKDRMSIRFSGTAGQVQSAFHTEIHNLVVNGAQHIANMSDPQIPSALAPAVAGVKSLHNFFPKPLHRTGSLVTRDSKTGGWLRPTASSKNAPASASTVGAAPHPLFGISVPAGANNGAYQVEDVAPYDFATIYNVLPLWNSNIDGTGQTIAIAGTSDIQLSDVNSFRSTFGLPAYTTNVPQTIVANGTDPGVCTSTNSNAVCGIGDLTENTLDVEWAGAVAKGAQIDLVVSGSNSTTTDTVYSSANYVVQNKATLNATILSVSYGSCELNMSSADNAAYNNLWETAANEGIAVFTATGDSGSAGCDTPNSASDTINYAVGGLAVSGLASSPWDTAVGGTDFNWCSLTTQFNGGVCSPSPYWNSSNSTATGASAAGYVPEIAWNNTCANPLAVTYLEAWADYVGISGVNDAETSCNFVAEYYPYINYNYGVDLSGLVNVSGSGGGASNCSTNTTVDSSSTVGTCTSGYAKPSWQSGVPGIPNDSARDIPDVSFFASNGYLSSSAYLICLSANGATCVTSTTTTTEPTSEEVGGTSVSTPAMAGVMALINQKTGAPQGNPNKQLYDLAALQTYSDCSAENGTTSSSCYFNDIDSGNNAAPCLAGSPNCTVLHTGDQYGILSGYSAGVGYDLATGLGSLNVANVVNHWPAAVGSGAAQVTVSPASATLSANTALNVTVTVASEPSGGATPTGTVTLSGGGYTSATETLSSGSYRFTIPADSLSAGSVTLTASYSGDATYAPVSGTAVVTVTKLGATVTVTPSATAINSNQSFTVGVTVTGAGGTATGTVQLTGGGYQSAAEPLVGGAYTFTIPVNSLNGGNDTLAVTYSGDATYETESGSTVVMVTTVAVLTPTVTVTPTAKTLDSASTLKVDATVKGSGPTPSGTVQLSGGGYTSAAEALVNGAYTFTIPANSLSAGSDTLTVNYSGDSSYASGMGTATVSVTQSAFTLSATTPGAIATPGGTAASTITVSSSTNYSGKVTLSCALTGYTQGDIYLPTCSIPNTAVAVGGTATATVSTTSATSELMYPKVRGGSGWLGAGSGGVLALLVFFGIPARRRSWRAMLGMVLLLVVLGGLAACGGGVGSVGGNPTGTTPDTYTFTVTGTGDPAVSPQPTTTFSVTVN